MPTDSDPSDFIIRGYQRGDEHKVAHLLHNCFPNPLNHDVISQTWNWQFRNEFSKNSGIGLAAHGSKIIGHRSVMWFNMICNGRRIKGGISSASATDPDYRRKGISSKIGYQLYENLNQDCCELVYAFSNDQNVDLNRKKLGFKKVNTLKIAIKPINIFSLLEKYSGKQLIKPALTYQVHKVLQSVGHAMGTCLDHQMQLKLTASTQIPSQCDDIWKTTYMARKIAIIRDWKYLHWRYLKRPAFQYKLFFVYSKSREILGYFILHKKKKFGLNLLFVMEFVVKNDSKRICRYMLSCLQQLALDYCVDAVTIFLQKSDPNYALFVKAGLVPVPRRFFPQKIFFSTKVLSRKIAKSYVAQPKNWYLSWGDLDVV